MPRDSLHKSLIQIRDFQLLVGAVSPCRPVPSSWGAGVRPGFPRAGHSWGWFCFWEGHGVIPRSVFPWQELTSAQMCCVLTAASSPASAQNAVPGLSPLSLACHCCSLPCHLCPCPVTSVLPALDAGNTQG